MYSLFLTSLLAISVVFTLSSSAQVPKKELKLQVLDANERPISSVWLNVGGESPRETNPQGFVSLPLAPGTKLDEEIELNVQPREKNLVFIDPWRGRIRVRSFANSSANIKKIVLAEQRDKQLLEKLAAQRAMASRFNLYDAPGASLESSPDIRFKSALSEVARYFGLQPDEIIRAIRQMGRAATQPYEKGLAELTERRSAAASAEFIKAINASPPSYGESASDLFDHYFFLGKSFYEEGKYSAAANTFQQALKFRENDPVTLNNFALSLANAGQYLKAEDAYNRSLARTKDRLGTEHLLYAVALNNLAELYRIQWSYAKAEVYYINSLAIAERGLGRDHSSVGLVLNNLAIVYTAQGRYSDAERLYGRSLSILEKTLGQNHPSFAGLLNNIAELYRKQGRNDAEDFYRTTIKIRLFRNCRKLHNIL